ITARSIEAGDKTELDWVQPVGEDNWNSCGRGPGRWRRRRATCEDHSDLTANQIGCQCRQSIVLTFRPTIFDCRIQALDVASLAQALTEGGCETCGRLRRRAVEESDNRHRRLLRTRTNRPRCCRAAD